MSGGTIGNYTLEYDIDINDGNGWTDSWSTLDGASLSAETIDPEDGFKLKIRITTTTSNLTAITYLRINTLTSSVAQANLYDLDLVNLDFLVLDAVTKDPISGARIFLETDPGGVNLVNSMTDASGQLSVVYPYLLDQDVTGRVRKSSTEPYYQTADIIGTITSEGLSQTILMISDS
jgi:hypothetical protein